MNKTIIAHYSCYGQSVCLVPRRYVLFYGLRGLCVGRVDQFDRFRCFSPSRAAPRALNDVNKPKRLGTRQVNLWYGGHHARTFAFQAGRSGFNPCMVGPLLKTLLKINEEKPEH
jgi:hypothetical protein